jgi:hypothetical protein
MRQFASFVHAQPLQPTILPSVLKVLRTNQALIRNFGIINDRL